MNLLRPLATSIAAFPGVVVRFNKPDEGTSSVASHQADAALTALVDLPQAVLDSVESEEQTDAGDASGSSGGEPDETGGAEGDEAGADEGPGSKDEGSEKETPAAEEEVIPEEWPDDAKERFAGLLEEKKGLATEKEKFESERAEIVEQVQLSAAAAINPMHRVATPEMLQRQLSTAREVRAWAREHLTEGGELPVELAKKVLQCEAEITGAEMGDLEKMGALDPEKVKLMLQGAENMLEEHGPTRLKFLQQEAATVEFARKVAPNAFDANGRPNDKDEVGKSVQFLLTNVPQLRTHPQWRMIALDWARGFTSRKAAEKIADKTKAGAKKTPAVVKNADGKEVPLAPGASTGGRRGSATPGGPEKKGLEDAAERAMSGKASDEDFVKLLQHAN